MSEYPSITCPKCQSVSYNPHDIAQGYCGRCCEWTSAGRMIAAQTACPHCLKEMNRLSSSTNREDGRLPKKGEVSLCVNCGELSVFADDAATKLRPAELNDLMKLPQRAHHEIDLARAAIKKRLFGL